MMSKCMAALLVLGVCSLFVSNTSVVTADEREEVNKFYKSVIQALKKPGHLKELIDLVEKNPPVANRCLAVCGEKAQAPGEQKAALSMVHDELQGAVILTAKPPKCDKGSVQNIIKLAAQQGRDDDDRIFLLERLTLACPPVGEGYALLGDLYLKQRRCGKAVKAYQTAVELTGDQDCRDLLQEARQCDNDYVNQKAIRAAEVKNLVAQERTMAPRKETVRKARIGNSIQRQVLFDEWSYQIKDEFLAELKVIGDALRDELSKHSDVHLVIEGHTDKRGPLERNMKLSKDRAEAIKNHLVRNYGINPAQLATEGFGPNRPYSADENEAGWALNRRVEFKKLD